MYTAVYSARSNLGFIYGGSLHDPEGLPLRTGKRMRHVTMRSLQGCANPALARLLEHAWTDGPEHEPNAVHELRPAYPVPNVTAGHRSGFTGRKVTVGANNRADGRHKTHTGR
jgi:hypothetical protein